MPNDWSNSLRTYLRKSLQDLCSLCRLDTVKALWHQLRSQLGTSVEILNMSLLVALTRARSLWGSAVKYVNSYVNRPIKLPSLTRLDPDSQSAEAWLTTDGGGFVAAGVGGGITGKGAHILVIDDPVKNRDEAESQNARDSSWDWYTSTAYTRLAPGGGVLVILTRWHDDDLAGRLLKAAADNRRAVGSC